MVFLSILTLFTQSLPVGFVSMDILEGQFDNQFLMPVTAEGVGYDNVNGIQTRIGYNTNQLTFNGIVDGLIDNLSVNNSNSIITINWNNSVSSIDLTSPEILFYINFSFIGNTNATLEFL